MRKIKDFVFTAIYLADRKTENCVKEVLSLIKWIGTMRNRGFGKVKISVAEQGENDD